MKIQCPQCNATYNVDESKLAAAVSQGRRVPVTCKKCANSFFLDANDLPMPSKGDSQPAPPGKPAAGEARQNNEEAVVKTLYDGIVRYVNQKKFREAEGLRNQLMKIAPMALSEIFSTGEMIESGKTLAMDPEKLKLWDGLYNTFSPTEAVAFYYALSELEAKANAPLFKQGDFDNKLYFVLSGMLKLSYFDTELDRHFSYCDLHPGDVAGSDAFFLYSCHTTTLTPIVDSKLLVLEKSEYERLIAENPAFEAKLVIFFTAKSKTCNFSSKKGQVRRGQKRYPVSLNAQVQMADDEGNRIVGKEIVNMRLVDISSGGLCYVVQNLKKQDAEKLHQQWVHISIPYKKEHIFQDVKVPAQIVSVKLLPFEECSVHVKFKKPLDERRILDIVQSSGKQG